MLPSDLYFDPVPPHITSVTPAFPNALCLSSDPRPACIQSCNPWATNQTCACVFKPVSVIFMFPQSASCSSDLVHLYQHPVSSTLCLPGYTSQPPSPLHQCDSPCVPASFSLSAPVTSKGSHHGCKGAHTGLAFQCQWVPASPRGLMVDYKVGR